MFRSIWKYFGVFLVLCIVNQFLSTEVPVWDAVNTLFFYGAHFVILGAWYWNGRKRLVDEPMRRNFRYIMIMQCSFILLQWIHHGVFLQFDSIRRLLWYMYYIPIVMIPVFMLQMTYNKKKPIVVLWILAIGLIVGVLTNDWHQWMFTFPAGLSEANYGHGLLFYIVMLWMLVLNVWMFILAFRDNRRIHNRDNYLGLVLMFIIYVIGFVYVMTKPWFLKRSLFSMCQGYMMLYILLSEYCIAFGVFTSNIRDEQIFRRSSLKTRIYSDSDQLIYCSDEPLSYTEEERELARDKGEWLTSDDELLRSHRIPGGYIQWGESIHELLEQRQRFEEQQANLLDEKAKLNLETELRERQSRIEVQAVLYEQIDQRLKDVMEKIDQELTEIRREPMLYEERMKHIHFMGTYVKRYSNLCILRAKDDVVDMEEFFMCIRESLHSLSLMGIHCDLRVEGSGRMTADLALKLYEEFYTRVMEQSEGANALMVVSRRDKDQWQLTVEVGDVDGGIHRMELYDGDVDGGMHRMTLYDGTCLVDRMSTEGGVGK